MKHNKSRRAHARKMNRRVSLIEKLEGRQMLVGDWHNRVNPVDVNNDLVVSPLDALVVINRLNLPEQRVLSGHRTSLAPFVDTDGDGRLSPLDALRVINVLNDSGALQNLIVPKG